MLELGDLAVPGDARPTEPLERLVDHALDDDRARGVVGARLGSEPQKADLAGVNVVVDDEAQDRVGGHGVDVLVGSAHPKAAADDRADLVPRCTGPAAPVLEADAVARHVDGHGADAGHVGGVVG